MKQNRLERVLRGMERMGLDQLLVTATDSVYYLTGLWVNPGERLFALKVDRSGACALYVNRMFALGAQQGLALVEFDDRDDALRLLAGDLAPGCVGVDKLWPSHFAIRLMELQSDVRLAVGSKPVDEARMLKDEEELARLRAASRANDQAVAAVARSLALGDSELSVGRRFADEGVRLGAQGVSFTPLVCFGANCAEPHHSSDGTRLNRGDAVILDLGLDVDHAMSDMTRTVFFGTPTDEQRRVYELVRRANAAAKAAVKPGVPLKDIDRAARAVIEDAGYGPAFLHRTGHGVGLAVHEPPDVSASSEYVAQPGMVFSIEPGIYLPGKFGVRIEDLVAVTEDGCEVLNELSRDLMVIE